MKFKKIALAILVLTTFSLSLNAQDKRTLKTKVADVLAYLPAGDNAQAERLFVELSNLGEDGIRMVTDQVQPNGNPAGIPYRFAVSLLTHYSTNALQKATIEKVYLYALTNATNTEVRAYFIDNLKLIGSDASVKPLSAFISDKELYNQAISAIQINGSASAHQALINALQNPQPFAHARLIQALGELKDPAALPMITQAVASPQASVKKQALWSLALIANPKSSSILMENAKRAGFKNDPSEATNALVEYLHNLTDKKLILSLGKTILENTNTSAQLHYRLAALEAVAVADPADATKLLVKEYTRFDSEYRKEVLTIAAPHVKPAELKIWEHEYAKSTGDTQAEIIIAMARYNRNEPFVDATLVPALSSANPAVRMAAAQEIAYSRSKKYAPALIDYLVRCSDDTEIANAKAAALQLIDKDNTSIVIQKMDAAPSKSKISLLQILSERRAVASFNQVLVLTGSSDGAVRAAAFAALPAVSSGPNVADLIKKLDATSTPDEIRYLQAALIASVDAGTFQQINSAYPDQKIKLVPVLPYIGDKSALDKVVAVFHSGTPEEKQIAFDALLAWQNNDAIPTLLAITKDPAMTSYASKALGAGIKQTSASTMTDDDKLVTLKEFMDVAPDKQGKIQVIRAAGNTRTFLSLVFVAGYLDDPELGSTASRAAMQLSLPTADAKPGMSGAFVRQTLEKIQEKLIGEDSQYERIDVATYLAKMPLPAAPFVLSEDEKKEGFMLLFNGKDLDLWRGNKTEYKVEDNAIAVYPARESHGNLGTIKEYSNFILRFEFQLTPGANNGIGIHAPMEGDAAYVGKEVQVLDDSAPVYATLEPWQYHGSVYGTIAAKRGFLKPVGEWNQEEIEVKGDYFKVTLNGTVITEGDVKKLSKNGTLDHKDHPGLLSHKGPIQFLGHGSIVRFRAIRIKEIK